MTELKFYVREVHEGMARAIEALLRDMGFESIERGMEVFPESADVVITFWGTTWERQEDSQYAEDSHNTVAACRGFGVPCIIHTRYPEIVPEEYVQQKHVTVVEKGDWDGLRAAIKRAATVSALSE
jgi:hypothetical protein